MRVVSALWYRSVKVFLRSKLQLILNVLLPFFYVFVLSEAFSTGGIENPTVYMLSGIIVFVLFQTALNISSSTVDDLVSGYMKEVLVSPVKRIQVVLGQMLASATIATFQGILVCAIGYFIGMTYTSFATPFFLIGLMVVIGITFSGFGLFISLISKDAQTFQILQIVITLPLTFLSGVYLPISMLPEQLRTLAYFNPVTYAASTFRIVSLEKTGYSLDQLLQNQLVFQINGVTITPLMGLIIVAAFGLLFMGISLILFTKIDFSKLNRANNPKDIFAQ